MTFRRSFLITFFLSLGLVVAFAAGYYAHDLRPPVPDLPILSRAYEILLTQGWKEVPETKSLEYGMIRGMIQAYDDPYTIFVEPVAHELESDSLQGSFGGIGVQLSYDDQGYIVFFPFPESAARKAGIQDGDRLLAVEDWQVPLHTTIEDVQSAIRGPVGQALSMTIGHPPDFEPVTVRVRREQIPLPSVTWHLDLEEPQVGIIDINLIAASTVEEIQKAVLSLEEQGATLFVLDLRDNPGGLLTAGVDIARLFLREGVVIEQQYRGQEPESFQVDHPGPLAEIPLVVLINHGSASAAEIVAGALQAHQRAKLVGEPSFGKDTIQLVFDLPDNSSIHITAAHWWVPGLQQPVGEGGLQPDIPVPPSETGSGPDTALQAAVQALLERSDP